MEPGPGSWGIRYQAGFTPWDLGRAHPALADRLERDPSLGRGEPGRAFVPGAGRGWDAIALAAAGWQVTAIDFAAGITERLPEEMATSGVDYLAGDAFAFAGESFDLIYDYTFFCAIPPRLRPEVGVMAERLLTPTGRFVAVVYPIGKDPASGGPPHGVTVDDYSVALGNGFELVESADPSCLPGKGFEHALSVWLRL